MNADLGTGSRRRIRLITRGAMKRLAILLILIVGLLIWAYVMMIRMPGESFRDPLPPLTDQQAALAAQLERDVEHLAGTIGDRNALGRSRQLAEAAAWIESQLGAIGYPVKRDEFPFAGLTCANIEAERKGSSKAEEIVVIGAHYDSVAGCPAANDNGSGVAATLALARLFARFDDGGPSRTLRFVMFVNEEPPNFQTQNMGSLVYANRCRERGEKITAMLSIETIGYYSDAPGSQQYPPPFGMLYPDTGNFIAFVGNVGSRALVREAIASFRSHAKFPSEGAAVPGWMPGVGWSDHWAFWKAGYPAIMITDTAPFRYPHYHESSDTPDKLDYERMARVVEGLKPVIEDLCAAR